jgi:hypothetical protein
LALFGLQNKIIDQQQYSVLVMVAILSAFVPTLIAQKFFQPTLRTMVAWGPALQATDQWRGGVSAASKWKVRSF